MNRRQVLVAGAALTGTVFAVPPVWGQAPRTLQDAAYDAYIFTLPLIESAAARARLTSQVGANAFRHSRSLADARNRGVTSPNNDTLYSGAWIDTAAGPARLTLPPTRGRYLSLALMDMYTNNFAVLGTRATGPRGARVTLVGPQAASDDPMAIRAPTRWVWALGRTLVSGPEDLPAVRQVQDALRLDAPAAGRPLAHASRDAPWPEYFRSAQALMEENPPPATDLALLARISPLGLGPGRRFEPRSFSPAEAAQIAAGVAAARRRVREPATGQIISGWAYPRPTLGDFGQDYVYRAQIALGGLAALPPAEATYMRALGPEGTFALPAGAQYRLRFLPGGAPPVDGFWSLTLYEITPEGQYYMAANALDRYAIGDRTPGLRTNADGSLDLWIGARDPGPARRANWLPASDAPFALGFRAYLPRPELLDGRYRLPALERL